MKHRQVRQRTDLEKFVGRVVIIVTFGSFLFCGVCINALQLLLLLTIGQIKQPKWRALYKKINGKLVWLMLTPQLSLLYYWCRFDVRICVDDMDIIEDTHKQQLMGVLLANHTFNIDYMMCIVLSDQVGNVGSYKSFSKDELKYLPVVGWSLCMSDMIFVKRDWKRDCIDLRRKLSNLFDYDQILLAIFAEGTRWTPEKHRASVEYAHSMGLKPLKHHLMPRVKGFTFAIRCLARKIFVEKLYDENLFNMYNLQIVMRGEPSFRDFLEGRTIRGDVYCERIPFTDELRQEAINTDDHDDCPKLTQLLLDTYQRKDEIVDEYRANGNKFVPKCAQRGGYFPYKRRLEPLIATIVGIIYTYSLIFYMATCTSLANSFTFWLLIIGFFSSTVWLVGRIARESKTSDVESSPSSSRSKVRDANHSTDATTAHVSPDTQAPIQQNLGTGVKFDHCKEQETRQRKSEFDSQLSTSAH